VVGNLITVLLQISSRLRHWENFENRPVFDEVMPKILLVRFFFRTQCITDTVQTASHGKNVLPATMFIGEIKREREIKSKGQNFCLGI